ncbi:hypothetical protein DYB37_010335 [Aphanomyces astaci]|uniref:START domain-containing protein n=2 Tax=Aphanomyces astaci TaxID=112090 RepID=A0A3R7BAW7_APHAT|nr:hypothetical protein DYB37_010335 [Aphanomyces astaci]
MTGGPIEWTLNTESNGLQIYWGSDIGNTDLTVFMSVAEIEGSLDEAAALHVADTPETYHAYISRYNKDVIDCAVLKTLAPPTAEHPHNYIGLKWLTLETPMALPWVPELRQSMGIVRATYENSGVVFQQVVGKPGYLRVAQLWNTNLRGFIPTWIQRIGIKRRARSVLAYDAYFRAIRLANEPLLDVHELVPPSSRRKCYLCQHVVCRHCNKKWEITDTRHITRLVRVCFKCSAGPPMTLDDSEDEGGASMLHPKYVADMRSEPARRTARKSHVHQPQQSHHPSDAPSARLPLKQPHQPLYLPQYQEQLQQHSHHFSMKVEPPTSPLRQMQKQSAYTSKSTTYNCHQNAPPPTQQGLHNHYNPWDDVPSSRDLPVFLNDPHNHQHHQPMYHQYTSTPQFKNWTNPGLVAGGPYGQRPITDDQRSADNNSTVSKAQLIDLYRQLKHMKLEGAPTPVSHAA